MFNNPKNSGLFSNDNTDFDNLPFLNLLLKELNFSMNSNAVKATYKSFTPVIMIIHNSLQPYLKTNVFHLMKTIVITTP